jgi:hypothetical protein
MFHRFLVALPPVRDLLLFAKHLFVAAMLEVPFARNRLSRPLQRRSNDAEMHPGGSSSDEQAIAEHLGRVLIKRAAMSASGGKPENICSF